jgi:hypothetical protein
MPLEHGQVQLAVPVEVGDGHAPHRPVQLLLDKDQVDDPDDPPVDQVDQHGQALAGHAAARELDHQVVDRAHLVELFRRTVMFLLLVG